MLFNGKAFRAESYLLVKGKTTQEIKEYNFINKKGN